MITEQKEVKMWHWLKRKLDKSHIHMQRIENTTGGGVPDVNMCYKGTDAWIELKVYVRGMAVLRKQQYAWITRRARANGNVLVMVQNPDTGVSDIWTPPFSARKWGRGGKYVCLEGEPEYSFEKKVEPPTLIRAIFGHN